MDRAQSTDEDLKRRFLAILALLPILFTLTDRLVRFLNQEFMYFPGHDEGPLFAPITLVNFAGNLVLWFLATKSKRLKVETIAQMWAALGHLTLFIVCAQSGGITSFASQWYAVIVMALGLLLPALLAYFWIGASVLQALALFIFFTPNHQDTYLLSLNMIQLQLMIMIAVWNYSRFQNLNRARIEEQKRNQEILLRVISHDVRNPMQVIVNAAERLLKPNVDLGRAEEQILKASKTIIGIIDHTKEQILLANSKISLNSTTVDLSALVERAAQGITDLAKEKGVQLEVKVRGTGGFFAVVDEQRFHDQVLENLLINAIKFSHPHGRIRISLSRTSRSVYIVIQDCGIGIPKKLLPQLFEFVPTAKRRGTAGEVGSGFGLSIAKSYLNAMGGTIHVRSREKIGDGKSGTAVKIVLPRTQTY